MAGRHNGNYVKLYSSRAHVFQINPETKNSWVPKNDQAIPISLAASLLDADTLNEPGRRELKIIATDETGEIVLDAVILPKTTFTKRSQKFGQWIDHAGNVYGLGFNSEAELTEFVESFQKLQRDVLSPPSHNPSASGSLQAHSVSQQDTEKQDWHQQYSNSASETNGRFQVSKNGSANKLQQYSNTLAHPGHHQQQARRQQQNQTITSNNGDHSGSVNGNLDLSYGNDSAPCNNSAGYPRSQSMFGFQTKPVIVPSSARTDKASPENENSPTSQTEWPSKEQLKYENERLKQILEESNKNAGIWNTELLNLRTNNIKLTQALQESKAHVEEWERELMNLRDENKEMKYRLLTLEAADDPEKGNELRKDMLKYKSYIDDVQDELRRKDLEIEELRRSMEEMELKTQNGQLGEASNSQFTDNPHQKHKLEIINAKFEAKIGELNSIQREFAQIVDRL